MKKTLSVLIAAVLLLTLFAGCKGAAPKQFSQDGFTLELTEVYLDYTEDDGERPFFYGNTKMGVVGLREYKSDMDEIYPDMTLEQYAQLASQLNEVDSEIAEKDGVPYFSYEADVDGEPYSYLGTFYETEDSFWLVQVYCKSADYADMESRLWKQATAVTLGTNG